MVLTRSEKQSALKHVLEVVFQQTANSNLHKTLQEADILSPHDICSLPDDELDMLQYTNDQGTLVPLSRGNIGLLKTFKAFVASSGDNHDPINDSNWNTVTPDAFDSFRISPAYIRSSSNAPVTTAPKPIDLVREFKRGIKRDISQFIPLKDDGAWDNWNRATIAQAFAQDVDNVLDPSYTPSNLSERELFAEKQKYMYAVFEKTLLTDKGKALVRQYQLRFNAQQIYKELKEYALQSTKATMDASSLLSYITTVKLGDGKWKGTTHAFILHWQDQIRKYHDLNHLQMLPHQLQRTMLENAVDANTDLRAVKAQAEQHKTHSGVELTYEQYCSLLVSAAQQYDKQLFNPASQAVQRLIYEHDAASIDGEEYINSTVAPIEAYTTSFTQGPHLTADQWHSLPMEAQTTWDLLSPDAKHIILQPHAHAGQPKANTMQQFPPHPPHPALTVHGIDTPLECLHDLRGGSQLSDNITENATSVHEATEQPILAHMTKKKPLSPDDIKKILSETEGLLISKLAIISYNVTPYYKGVKWKGALVDRGANCGMLGDDARVISFSGRHYDVQGIANQQIHDLPIVTAGAVVSTQKGEVIIVMNQYVYSGFGHTIHSSIQMEAYNHYVDDKSNKAGGRQFIRMHDKYIILLNIRAGLPYMLMRPYTDEEWKSLPHIILTSDKEWNPSKLNVYPDVVSDNDTESDNTNSSAEDLELQIEFRHIDPFPQSRRIANYLKKFHYQLNKLKAMRFFAGFTKKFLGGLVEMENPEPPPKDHPLWNVRFKLNGNWIVLSIAEGREKYPRIMVLISHEYNLPLIYEQWKWTTMDEYAFLPFELMGITEPRDNHSSDDESD